MQIQVRITSLYTGLKLNEMILIMVKKIIGDGSELYNIKKLSMWFAENFSRFSLACFHFFGEPVTCGNFTTASLLWT